MYTGMCGNRFGSGPLKINGNVSLVFFVEETLVRALSILSYIL